MRPTRGDVVRSRDPFKDGRTVQRPWLVISSESHPFAYEQCIAIALSTREYPQSVPIADDHWQIGGVPERSYCSPWAVHSPRYEDLVAWQGTIESAFVDRVVDSMEAYVQ